MPPQSITPEIIKPLIPVFSEMPFPISLTDARNHYVFVNDAFERKYGHTLAALQGRGPGILTPRGSGVSDALLAELHTGTRNGGWSGQLANASRQGKRFRVGLRTMPIAANGILPKSPLPLPAPAAAAKPDEPLFLGVACEAGTEDMRDRAMLELLFKRILTQNKAPTPADTAAEAAQLATQPKRRKEVYQLLSEGRSYKEIAYHLNIADATVRVVVAELRKQLGDARVPRLRRD
jgi:PAS domain S-box-containing protein